MNREMVAILLGLAMTLIGCQAMRVEELRRTDGPSGGTTFTRALFDGYRSLALAEADTRNDWSSASRFSEKAMAASRGEVVAPEDPDDWPVRPAINAELFQARTRLLAVLPELIPSNPDLAATAQLAFDRWVKTAAGRWRPQEFSDLRDAFERALGTAETVYRSRPKRAEPVPQ